MVNAESPAARVVYDLEVENGWPPVTAERLWSSPRARDRYVIDNVPFFVRDCAVGDLVLAVAPDPDSHPVFRELLEPSDHVTIRVICMTGGPLLGDLARAADPFVALGVAVERSDDYGMLALDISHDLALAEIAATLVDGEADGSWQYEEGRVTDAWLAATS